MKKMGKQILNAAIVVLELAVLAQCACDREIVERKQEISVDQTKKDIRDHLPVGSSRQEVSTFLDERKITHSHVGEIKGSPESSRTEMALIRDVSTVVLIRKDIQIVFRFDETDSKLVSYSVQEVLTGS
jgi:hypothetical protein